MGSQEEVGKLETGLGKKPGGSTWVVDTHTVRNQLEDHSGCLKNQCQRNTLE